MMASSPSIPPPSSPCSTRLSGILTSCGISPDLRHVVLALSAEDGVMKLLKNGEVVNGSHHRVEELKDLVDRALQFLQNKLQAEMRLCHNVLLDKVSSVSPAEELLADVRRHVDRVSQLAHRLSKEALEPCGTIRKNLNYLRRLDEVQDAVRVSLQHMVLVKKLRQLTTSTPQEWTKIAQTIMEVEDMAADERTQKILTSLEFLQADIRFVAETGGQLRTAVSQQLQTGLQQQKGLAVGECFRVHRQLRNLEESLDRAIDELVEETVETFGAQQAISGASSFLQELTRFLGRLETGVKQGALVQQVLDSLREEGEEDEPDGLNSCTTNDSVISRYWCATVLAFKHKAKPVLSSRREVLVPDCPRIRQQLQMTFNNIAEQHVAIGITQERMFQDIFNELVDEYIDISLHALTDPVHLMFPLCGGDVAFSGSRVVVLPTPADIKAYAAIVTSQLAQVRAVPDMAHKVSQNVSNSILLLSNVIDSLVDDNSLHLPLLNDRRTHVLSSIAGATAGHQRNARLHGLAFALHSALSSICMQGGRGEADVLGRALEQLQATKAQIMRSWLKDMQEALGEVCMDEMFNRDHPKKYIHDIKQVCTSVLQQYLCYVPSAHVANNLKTSCAFILHSFVCHACLLGSLEEARILSLAADMAELEVSLTSLLGQMHQLLKPDLVLFHSFRRLLFLDCSALTQQDELSISLLPPLIVGLHVTLSRLSPDPAAFFQQTNLTPQQMARVIIATTSPQSQVNSFPCSSSSHPPPLMAAAELSRQLLAYIDTLRADPTLLPLVGFVRVTLQQLQQ
eukprot:GHVS01043903.1.p1 GENE.GHVS01043903.1~~GHVS01043903.1.p1  ORF type:complete len:797 (+),score=156.87 GHVS01043903.1:305-2695(+)